MLYFPMRDANNIMLFIKECGLLAKKKNIVCIVKKRFIYSDTNFFMIIQTKASQRVMM